MSVSGTILNLATLSTSIPAVLQPEVEREAQLDQIELLLRQSRVVLVKGPSGIGKTALLAQFARRNPDHSISLFIDPGNIYTYDMQFILGELCQQLEFAVKGQLLPPDFEPTEATLYTYFPRLGQRLKDSKLHFIIDGLHHLSEAATISRILALLPFKIGTVRFLISVTDDRVTSEIRKKDSDLSTMNLTGFDLSETQMFFKDLSLTSEEITVIHRRYNKLPRALAISRRHLDARTFEAAEALPANLNALFEFEWEQIEQSDISQWILSTLAHSRNLHSPLELAKIADCEEQAVLDFIALHNFINLDSQQNKVRFESEQFRSFAEGKVKYRRPEVISRIIERFVGDLSDTNSQILLTNSYSQAGRFHDLIEFLAPDRFNEIMHLCSSVGIANHIAELGMDAAIQTKNDQRLFLYALFRTIMSGLILAESQRHEVKALARLGQVDNSLTLAYSAPIREDRLILLSIVADQIQQDKEPIPSDLLDHIMDLHNQTEYASLNHETAMSIAIELLPVNPQLAIEAIERTHSAPNDVESLDWALMHLTLAAESEKSLSDIPAVTHNIRSRIKDDKVRNVSYEIAGLVANLSAEEVVERLKEIDGTSEKLLFLRNWAQSNRERSDSHIVIDYSLDIAVQDATYKPSASVIVDLATPLAYIKDKEILERLIPRFDVFAEIAHQTGPTPEYVRLRLILARAQNKIDTKAAERRFMEIASFLPTLNSVKAKADAYARMLAVLADLDKDKQIDWIRRLSDAADIALENAYQQLLDTNAGQFPAAESVLRSLVRFDVYRAIKYAERLNTELARNDAYEELALTLLRRNRSAFPYMEIELLLTLTTSQKTREAVGLKAILNVVKPHSTRKAWEQQHFIWTIFPMLNDPVHRCQALCVICEFLQTLGDEVLDTDFDVSNALLQAWKAIDATSVRIQVAFRIAASLADTAPELAQEYLEVGKSLKSQTTLYNADIAGSYFKILRLVIRGLDALIYSENINEVDIKDIYGAIERIPAKKERAILWSEFILVCYYSERPNLAIDTAIPNLLNIYSELQTQDSNVYGTTIAATIPAIYLFDSDRAMRFIRDLGQSLKDAAYQSICEMLVFQQLPGDSLDYRAGTQKVLNYPTIQRIISLLEHAAYDSMLAYFTDVIVASISNPLSRLTKEQKESIITELRNLAIKKLPSPSGIQHVGYRLIALAGIEAAARTKNDRVWTDLVYQARQITNIADRILVLATIGKHLPTRMRNLCGELLEEAEKLLPLISTLEDLADRAEIIADVFDELKDFTNRDRILRVGFDLVCKSDTSETEETTAQRNMIDAAYRLSPRIAESLTSVLDDDPIRKSQREMLRSHVEVLEARNKLTFEQTEARNDRDVAHYAEGYWEGLNSGRRTPVEIESTRQLLRAAGRLPFTDSYPILGLITRSVVLKYRNDANGVAQRVRPLFESLLASLKLIEYMAFKNLGQIHRENERQSLSSTDDLLVVPIGETEKALQYIFDWFQNVQAKEITICDPFFGAEEMSFIFSLFRIRPTCTFRIVTSFKPLTGTVEEEIFSRGWRKYSDDQPPAIIVTILGLGIKKESPIHDRWILTESGGLDLGTSLNGLGKRLSKIKKISAVEANHILVQQLQPYLQQQIIKIGDADLDYKVFRLR